MLFAVPNSVVAAASAHRAAAVYMMPLGCSPCDKGQVVWKLCCHAYLYDVLLDSSPPSGFAACLDYLVDVGAISAVDPLCDCVTCVL